MMKFFCDGCSKEIKGRGPEGHRRLYVTIKRGMGGMHGGDFHACSKGCLIAALSDKLAEQ